MLLAMNSAYSRQEVTVIAGGCGVATLIVTKLCSTRLGKTAAVACGLFIGLVAVRAIRLPMRNTVRPLELSDAEDSSVDWSTSPQFQWQQDPLSDSSESNSGQEDPVSVQPAVTSSVKADSPSASEDLLLGPISFEPLEEPVIDALGHTYERVFIQTWLKKNNTSPISSAELPNKKLIPNRLVLSLLSTDETKYKPLLRCPIQNEPLVDPVVAADGHTYNRRDITKWVAKYSHSPVTQLILAHTRLIPNCLIRSILERMGCEVAMFDRLAQDQELANRGDAEAQFRMGQRYEKGNDVQQSDEDARQWYRRAVLKGHAEAQSRLNELVRNLPWHSLSTRDERAAARRRHDTERLLHAADLEFLRSLRPVHQMGVQPHHFYNGLAP